MKKNTSLKIPIVKPSQFDSFLFGDWKAPNYVFYEKFHIERIETYKKHLQLPTPPHRRSVYFLIFLTKGKVIRSKGLSYFDILPNHFFILPPDQITSIEYVSEDAEGFYCHFQPEIFNLLKLKIDLQKDFPFFQLTAEPLVETTDQNRIKQLLLILENENQKNQKERFELIPLYLYTLLTEIKFQIQTHVLLSEIFDLNKPYKAQDSRAMQAKAAELKKKIFEKDSTFCVAFAKAFQIKIEDLPMSFFHNENVLRDIAQKAGGNPFDNTNTIYSGFPDDLKVNQRAERLASTVDNNVFVGKYDRTGNINKPTLLLHTLYDQLIPAQFAENNFENMVLKQGKNQYFSVKYTNGQGHCQFTPQQLGQAFDELRTWTKTGIKAKAGYLE